MNNNLNNNMANATTNPVKFYECEYCGRSTPEYAECNCFNKRLYKKLESMILNNNKLENTFFEKVSYDQFKKDFVNVVKAGYSDEYIKDIYDKIKLPTRATNQSAGYDFYMPYAINVNGKIKGITGIKVSVNDGWCLMCMPKSGLGSKYELKLSNTIGLIDADYYNNKDNEGHIMFTLNSSEPLELEEGQKFMQGVFVQFGITRDDANVEKEERAGGFGSTGK